jgi:hypothetical protein
MGSEPSPSGASTTAVPSYDEGHLAGPSWSRSDNILDLPMYLHVFAQLAGGALCEWWASLASAA